jgi:hypothetical protein
MMLQFSEMKFELKLENQKGKITGANKKYFR